MMRQSPPWAAWLRRLAARLQPRARPHESLPVVPRRVRAATYVTAAPSHAVPDDAVLRAWFGTRSAAERTWQ